MYQAITFDLWQTLIADTPSIDKKRTRYRILQIRKVLAGEDIQVSVIELSQAHQEVWEQCQIKWKKARDISFEDQITLFLNLVRPGLAKKLKSGALKEIEKSYAQAVLLYSPRTIKGADQTLRELRADGYRMGLICNTGRTPGFVLRKLLSRFRLLKYFDVALFSDETIIRKPDPRIFRLALKVLNCPPSRALHVGDDLKNDVRGALRSGMEVLWIEQPEQRASAKIKRIKSVAGLPRHLNKKPGS
ncbi:HAD family hydrolase [candidate division TA06 bacterium]|uniref:HAD family hydrolase n=1 Tax=candidate division TA06 bacterium TaxID=2250710 RepID=A0A933ICX5_UNCT6|nr:HAD family hydrolase [candidate division TA06 bacterium]